MPCTPDFLAIDSTSSIPKGLAQALLIHLPYPLIAGFNRMQKGEIRAPGCDSPSGPHNFCVAYTLYIKFPNDCESRHEPYKLQGMSRESRGCSESAWAPKVGISWTFQYGFRLSKADKIMLNSKCWDLDTFPTEPKDKIDLLTEKGDRRMVCDTRLWYDICRSRRVGSPLAFVTNT